MSDPTTPVPETNPTPAPRNDVDPSWLNERLERAQRAAEEKILKRLGISDLDSAEKALKDKAEAEQQAALARGEHEKVINELRPKAERVEAVDKFITDMLAKRIEALPEQYKGMVPKYTDPLQTLEWLEANASVLGAPPIPDLNAGVGGDRPQNQQLTAAELETARKMRITPEQYAKFKATGNTN